MTGKTSTIERLKTVTCASAASHSSTTPEKPAVASGTATVQNKPQPISERMARRVGRPRRYATPEAMEAVIDRYLQRARRPTMTGLARALGFSGRQALLNYKRYGEEFEHTVRVARLRMECHYEELLLTPGYSTAAAIKALKRLGWRG